MFTYKDSALRVNFIRVSLKEIIGEIIKELNCKIEESNIELNMEVEDKYAIGVKSEIKVIIFNLLDIVIKYSRNKRIHLILYDEKDNVKLEVFNKCREISKTILDRFFKKFFELGRENVDVGTSGLGLFFCKQLAELNEGKIDFEYKKNNIRFILTLKKTI